MRLTTFEGRGAASVFDRLTGLLRPDQFDDRVLVAVLEPGRIELGGLGLDDVPGEIPHLGRQLKLGDVLEVGVLPPHLVGIAQDRGEQSLAERLEQDHALAAGEDHAGNARLALVAHGVADDGESLLGDLVVRGDVVGRLEIALVDLLARHEALDVDRVGALDLDRVELLVLDEDVGALADLVALDLLVVLDRLARLGSMYWRFTRLPVSRLRVGSGHGRRSLLPDTGRPRRRRGTASSIPSSLRAAPW